MIKELTIEKTSLPVGWEMKKIDEVVIDYHQGLNTAGQKIKFVDEGYPIIQTRNLNQGEIDISSKIKFMSKVDWELYKDKYKPSVGDVFLTNIGTIGKTAVVTIEEDYLIHWNIFIFKLDKSKVLPLYLKLFLDSPSSFDYYHSFQKGGTVSFITKKMISNLEIPLPPLPQQKQIVATLDKAFAAIDTAKVNAEQNLQNANELFENTLQILFDNKNWEHKKLGEIASFKNGMNFTKSSKGQSIDIVGVKNFKNKFWVPFEELEKVILDGEMSEAYQLKKGDIITVRSNGNPKLIGRTLLANEVNGSVSHSGFTIRIRLNSNTLHPAFLCHYLKTSKTRKELVDSGNGVGIKSLNQGSLSSLMIPYPKSEEEQKLIVNKIEGISKQTKKLEAIYTQKIADLDEMKKSVLQKAFSGQLSEL
jgi:type I restriction enzyme S subunit